MSRIAIILLMFVVNTMASIIQTSPTLLQQNESITELPELAITLDTSLDDVDLFDPRLKSVVTLAQMQRYGIQIIYYYKDNKKYINDLVTLFKRNKVSQVTFRLLSSRSLLDKNKVKIYYQKESKNAN